VVPGAAFGSHALSTLPCSLGISRRSIGADFEAVYESTTDGG
jgi:hypothetical protein